jgi:glycine oxidase
MASPSAPEFLIVGGGLAGCTLAWALRRRGREVAIVDAGAPETCSKVAAGLVTPITGQRLTLGWRMPEFLPVAVSFYQEIEAITGRRFYFPRPIQRTFRQPIEVERWAARRERPEMRPFITEGAWTTPAALTAPLGGVTMTRGGWLDVPEYLRVTQAALETDGAWITARLSPEEAVAHPARRVIFCLGPEAVGHPLFSWLKWKTAKGEMLDLWIDPALAAATGLTEEALWIGPVWLQPRGAGWWRVGATYEWQTLDPHPTAAARADLTARLQGFLQLPFTITGHRAAIRPILRESRARIGLLPRQPKIGFFNGLGSKGTLHAPWFAHHFATHLCDGHPLDPDCDLLTSS